MALAGRNPLPVMRLHACFDMALPKAERPELGDRLVCLVDADSVEMHSPRRNAERFFLPVLPILLLSLVRLTGPKSERWLWRWDLPPDLIFHAE